MGQTYSRGILSDPIDLDGGVSKKKTYPKVAAAIGLDVTHIATSMIGSVIECTPAAVVLRDDSGRDHRFRNTPGGFLVDGRNVELITARTQTSDVRVSASGSITAGDTPARVARASRLLVEGIHDAELIEKVWGDDLRSEGIVVQPLGGVDDLVEVVRGFAPRPGRRLGILVDHLIANTKESRIASAVNHPEVLVRGHVFVDVWAAINPRLVGLDAWPDIPRDQVWKDGICAAVGADDSRRFWKQLIGRVSSYRDLDPSLVGAVEELIDFVTESS
jgi:hypothetical protein